MAQALYVFWNVGLSVSVEEAFTDLKPNTPNLKCLAAQWGLPVDTITKASFGPTALLRVCACAAYTSTILAA